MNVDAPSERARLNDDGELLDGKFCSCCGKVSFAGKRVCEHCGTTFPEPFSPMRLRLEALRNRDSKKFKRPHNVASGPIYTAAVLLVLILTVIFGIVVYNLFNVVYYFHH